MHTSTLIQQFHFMKFAQKKKLLWYLKNNVHDSFVKMGKIWKGPKIASIWNWLHETLCFILK